MANAASRPERDTLVQKSHHVCRGTACMCVTQTPHDTQAQAHQTINMYLHSTSSPHNTRNPLCSHAHTTHPTVSTTRTTSMAPTLPPPTHTTHTHTHKTQIFTELIRDSSPGPRHLVSPRPQAQQLSQYDSCRWSDECALTCEGLVVMQAWRRGVKLSSHSHSHPRSPCCCCRHHCCCYCCHCSECPR